MELLFANGVAVEASPNAKEPGSDDQGVRFNDRALQYGDGVFETMRIVNGEIPMWEFHLQRLRWAQTALKLPLDDFLFSWETFKKNNLFSIQNACAKLVISRGTGPRGYKVPEPTRLNWWLQVSDMPQAKSTAGYRLTLCQHTLSRQPALAGLKHLNRLDQVMARSEWDEQAAFDEGIMFNLDGDVVEGTMSNIFWLEDDQLYSPDLSQEGVDGCVRRWIIEQAENNPLINLPAVIIEKNTKLNRLLAADAVFLTNSLMGIKRVAEINKQAIVETALGCERVNGLAELFNAQFAELSNDKTNK